MGNADQIQTCTIFWQKKQQCGANPGAGQPSSANISIKDVDRDYYAGAITMLSEKKGVPHWRYTPVTRSGCTRFGPIVPF
ncbi:hypothetical protein A4R26_14950 [Niastella populi]|uniref:Uncharacterized protein n=1 Tax=Niastella populi TaxID=550983 RepID=A0A1V9G3G8_9BACT|nr:hypothetical protein A4R26_14950 [Niastella populi]